MPFLRTVFVFSSFTVMIAFAGGKTKPSSPTVKKGASDSLKAFRDNFYPAVLAKDAIIKHTAFTLCYDEEAEQAKWVAYRLTADMVRDNAEERTNNFRSDKAVETGSAATDDYKKSGYDRGHLCPAGDMAWSEITMSESFLMSNISPQKPGFNRGIWKKLETDVRGWAKKESELYIITAGVLEKTNNLTIGSNKVLVPACYYKVILDVHGKECKAIAFILPNESSSRPVFDYAVSIDSVEKLTHIDFFPALPDVMENELESHLDPGLWK